MCFSERIFEGRDGAGYLRITDAGQRKQIGENNEYRKDKVLRSERESRS